MFGWMAGWLTDWMMVSRNGTLTLTSVLKAAASLTERNHTQPQTLTTCVCRLRAELQGASNHEGDTNRTMWGFVDVGNAKCGARFGAAPHRLFRYLLRGTETVGRFNKKKYNVICKTYVGYSYSLLCAFKNLGHPKNRQPRQCSLQSNTECYWR